MITIEKRKNAAWGNTPIFVGKSSKYDILVTGQNRELVLKNLKAMLKEKIRNNN